MSVRNAIDPTRPVCACTGEVQNRVRRGLRCCSWPDTALTESEHRMLNDTDSPIFTNTATSSAHCGTGRVTQACGSKYLDMNVNTAPPHFNGILGPLL